MEDPVFGKRYVAMPAQVDEETLTQIAEITGGAAPALERRNASVSDAEAVALAQANASTVPPVAAFEMFVELHRAYNEDFTIPEDVRFALARRKKAMRATLAVPVDAPGLPALPPALEDELEAILRERTGLKLGESLDPEHDLEGRFQVWLQERR